MNTFAVPSDSSDSGSFERFVSEIRPTKDLSKYRLSTNSLEDFITDDSHASCVDTDSEHLQDGKDFLTLENGSFEVAPSSPKYMNDKKVFCVNENEENDKGSFQSVDASSESERVASFITKSTCINVPRYKGMIHNNIVKGKSVATPLRRISYSSDSDDDVFITPATSRKKKTKNTPCRTLNFSDSEKENDFKTENGISKKIPQFILSASDSEDHAKVKSLSNQIFNCNNAIQKPFYRSPFKSSAYKKSVMNSDDNTDSEDNEGFISLKDRLFQCQLPSESGIREKLRGPSIGSMYTTPKPKPALKTYFHSERNYKTAAKPCSVKGCFLASLDASAHKSLSSKFNKTKLELSAKLFHLFNDSVFEGNLPHAMEIRWAKRLTKTAGITKCQRITETHRSCDGDMISSTVYRAEIALSDKVIDCASRLRDTLIHELCHAAVWIINNVSESHGPFWKSWALKARKVHPELPSIDRCHNYDIAYKYSYECTRCKSIIGRHSKSIDTEKKACGRCSGKLVLLSKRKGANPFANFVKENYKSTKTKMDGISYPTSHRNIMKSLSEQFKAVSVS